MIVAAIQAAAAAVLAWASLGFLPRVLPTPRTANYRGAAIPVSLGMALAFALAVTLLASPGADAIAGRATPSSRFWLAALVLAVFAAGFVDDRQPRRIRGARTHLRELVHGRVTTGIVKLAVFVAAAAVWTALATSGSFPRVLLGTPVIAGTANLWNLLDVAPGRALKAGLVAAGAILAVAVTGAAAMALGATAALLPFDLRERAMLGDSGANVLGFVLGVELYGRLSTPELAVSLAAVLALHLVADTVTFSRIIRAVPPLRWFDGLGRVRGAPDPENSRKSGDS